MRPVLLTAALLAVGALACDSVIPTAPSGSRLTISANPDRISGRGSSEITVVARREDGRPVNEGTIVFLSSNRGQIPESATTDVDGVARATLLGNDAVGTATVRANAGAAAEVTVDVQIGVTTLTITLQASPATIAATNNPAPISLVALVRDDEGQPLQSQGVNFGTDVGTLESRGALVFTDENGEARDELRATRGELDVVIGDSFVVRAEVGGSGGELALAERTITIARRPVADFTVSVSGLTVVFTDTSTGRPTDWDWDFGDGNSSRLQNPTHSYATAGTYTVELEVSNSVGSDRRSRNVAVTGN